MSTRVAFIFQIPGTNRTRDHAVSSKLTMLVNASDNNARVRCEATNSATEIPLFKVLTLKVNCKAASDTREGV